MKPALTATLVAGAIAAVAALGSHGVPPSIRHGPPAPSGRGAASANALAAPCPPGTLPDEGVCIPVGAAVRARAQAAAARIPRRPDRPAEYAHYALPVEGTPEVAPEADSPASDGGAAASGVAVHTADGTAVHAVALTGQDGPAHVVYEGPLFGGSVVSLHRVLEHDRERLYLVVLGGAAALPSLAPHAELAPRSPLGHATTAPLHLDVRRVQAGVDVFSLSPRELTDDANSVAEDPRNVLQTAP